MGWVPAYVRQWKSVLGHWFRLNAMDNTCINKTVFNWSFSLKHRNKNWCFQIENYFKKSYMEAFMPVKHVIVYKVENIIIYYKSSSE